MGLMATTLLVGPPEIYYYYQQPPKFASSSASADPTTRSERRSIKKSVTKNNSPTLLSSGNPCLDFFFHIVPYTPPETINHRLKLAWDHDPLKALKLVCNLRGVKGTGKSDRESFYTSALWLHQHHPKTLAGNAAAFAGFGYWSIRRSIKSRCCVKP